jgi:hypothetical protein
MGDGKMKSEDEIREKIKKYYEGSKHILEQTPKDVVVNAYVAMAQCNDSSFLEALYWVLGETRPHMKCDEFDKINKFGGE